jgi:hypothetical protein
MGVVESVEFLYWEGCPSHDEALVLLQDVLQAQELDVEIVVREVTSEEEAVALGFPGSPTIRVDGRDVDPSGESEPAALTCRIYRLEDGRPSPVPSRAQLEEALR